MVIPAIGFALLLQGAGQGGSPEVVTRSRVDHSRGVDFHALVVPETVYVGQQATYQLGVFLDQDTRQRIRRNPEFQPPETRSLLSYDLRERGNGSLNSVIDGRPYEVHVFRRALFPLTPGRYAIPPARLTYALPQSASYFSREQNYSLRAEGVSFVAIEPPLAGRPVDWAGAVGSWSAMARMDTARGRTGEPFILTLRIEGQGNVTLLPRPPVSVSWASVVNADERVRLDSTPSLLGGSKEFDWLVTPATAGTQRIPALRYAFFNPRTRRYEIAMSQMLTVRVATGDVVATVVTLDAGPDDAPMIIQPELGDDAPLPLSANPLVLIALILAPLGALGAWFARRPRRVKPAATPAQRLAAIGARADADALGEVRRALIDGLCIRTGLDAARFTATGAWTMALRKRGVTPEAAVAVEALVSALDAACFAGSAPPQPRGAGWSDQAREALRIVDTESWRGRRVPTYRSRATPAAGAAALLVLLAAVPVFARLTADARDSFALGATAYAGGDFVRAARHFADAARSAPRSPAAWANVGTAAFQASDTANAALGWQRALRLDPLDATTRARLSRLRAPQESGVAHVPALPRRGASVLALLLWLTGWTLVARQAWQRRAAARMAVGTFAFAGAAVWGAWALERRLEGEGLVIVTGAVPLRALPALGADARSTPMAGEVARVIARRGVWVQIRLDGARDGWIPLERVAALGGSPGDSSGRD